ncbi:uncharacterized protein LOC143280791 isoform X2 [Babylonia areolata]|uniref:uncharacterized protein LOC143280791 isoform X2 n=1 Tax=Babylonia areolata TaxID=304850 RepID=UPI003FCFABC6
MSAKTEIPGVNNAVEKLQELEDRMRTDDFGFRNNDVDNIDKVINALYELEAERKKMHEELEKETIQSSILRHQLRILPGQIRDEVMEAVMSARLSNANVLLELQEKLKGMNNNITALDRKARELEQENAVLQPERELLKQQHEEIIAQLNQRMAEKASLQIALNETRDKVRQANQDIVDLEDGILQLKEDLIQERTEARQEKKRLKKAVTDTTQKTREQKDQNVTKKKELDIAQENLTDSEGKLDAVRKSIRRYETSRAKLEGEERALAAQLSNQLKMNDQMRIRGTEIMNARIQEERGFKKKQQELLDTIKQFEEDIVTEGARSKELEKKKVELLLDLREKEEVREEDAERVAELDANLQVAKEALNAKAEEVGAMQTENVDMSEQIEALAESHKAVLAQLNKQIEEYREQLSKERKERLEVQAMKDNVSKNLDDLKTENQFFMSEMTNVVQDGKKKHQDLSNEGMMLQKALKVDEEEISVLEDSLNKAQKKYQSMFDDYQKRTDMMESEVLSLESGMEEKKKQQEERTPIFQELEAYFSQRTEEYNKMKKDIVDMKNKKQSLEDEIRRMKKDRESLKQPQDQIRKDLRMKRHQLVEQMQSQGKANNDMEHQILTAGCKLRAVVEENHKFEESCRKLEAELADLDKQMEENDRIRRKLEEEMVKQKDELIKKWESDNMMQEFFASRDEATAEAFGRLLSRTEKRENKIDLITERLKEELQFLAGFLDNISTRRPDGSKRKVRVQGTGRKHHSRASRRSRSRSQSGERRSGSKSRGESRHGSHSDGEERLQSPQPPPSRTATWEGGGGSSSRRRSWRKERSQLSSGHGAKSPLHDQ